MFSASPLLKESALPLPPDEGAGLGDPDPLLYLDEDGQSSFGDWRHDPDQASWLIHAQLAIADM